MCFEWGYGDGSKYVCYVNEESHTETFATGMLQQVEKNITIL